MSKRDYSKKQRSGLIAPLKPTEEWLARATVRKVDDLLYPHKRLRRLVVKTQKQLAEERALARKHARLKMIQLIAKGESLEIEGTAEPDPIRKPTVKGYDFLTSGTWRTNYVPSTARENLPETEVLRPYKDHKWNMKGPKPGSNLTKPGRLWGK